MQEGQPVRERESSLSARVREERENVRLEVSVAEPVAHAARHAGGLSLWIAFGRNATCSGAATGNHGAHGGEK